jgi:nitric-oxide synthase, bacterial
MATRTNTFLLQNVKIFAPLGAAELDELAGSVTLRQVKAGQEILREGDYGDVMYVIENGAVQIYTQNFDGSDLVLARLEAGQAFGEQALLSGGGSRRNASARALEDSRLLVITGELLRHALREHPAVLQQLQQTGEEQREERRRRLQEAILAPMGANLPPENFRFESFKAGDVVFHQGAPGDRVYLILSGSARVISVQPEGERELARLDAGQFFGHVAILKDEPRSATVAAATNMETASIDGAWFRELHKQNPTLRSLLQTLSSMYLLPSSELVVLQTGQIDGEMVLTSTHHLRGRTVLTTRFLNRSSFIARFLEENPSGSQEVRFVNEGLFRQITVAQGKIAAIYSEGEWLRLGETLAAMISGREVHDWELRLFESKGAFSSEDVRPTFESREVICACANVTCGQVDDAMRAGCTTLDALAASTGATRVCGGCTPLVNEMLGRSDFTPARVVDVLSLNRHVRSFRIRTIETAIAPYRPGQYIMVQAKVDGRWIQRAYTLSAPFSDAGEYEITVKKEPEGVFSPWLFHRADIHYPIRISKPMGHFVVPEDNENDVVFLVGGIGVTPALCFARSYDGENRPYKLHVDYSVSAAGDAICSEELSELARRNPNLTLNLRTTRTQGRLSKADVYAILASSPDAVFYLCGSERFLDGMQSLLRDCGVPSERVRLEAFTAAGEKPKAAASTAPAGCPVPHGQVAERPKSPLEEAEVLLRQYYSEIDAQSVIKPRLVQVRDEFARTGTYTQTYDELTFAARLAWRNSIRCIGRLYWQGLTVRDFRHVTTAEEMFQAIFEHIEYADNGGNIRPTMTVFRPQLPDQPSPRVWSPQFFRYAGYAPEDGPILGDPGNREFTDIAISLGWKPPQTRSNFDLLPVVVNAAGQPPEFREIPPHLVREVNIVHPEFPWFAELGLKWYAVPAVSCMLFDAGGVLYPAAPFNGWYMGTEIGARNFTDTYRYNLLPEVARRMGLDTTRDALLWKDRALVEINVAVIYSYEQAGVKLMDHHSAAQSFDKFEEMEKSKGRPVYTKWSWVVPPMSGSTVPVFHREWQELELKPNYFVQPDPWHQPLSKAAEGGS